LESHVSHSATPQQAARNLRFKEGAARLVTEQGRTIADAAKSLDISPWTMSRWVKAARTEGTEAFRGHGQHTPLEQENFEL
jgi:transposase-like protein